VNFDPKLLEKEEEERMGKVSPLALA